VTDLLSTTHGVGELKLLRIDLLLTSPFPTGCYAADDGRTETKRWCNGSRFKVEVRSRAGRNRTIEQATTTNTKEDRSLEGLGLTKRRMK
jgi:hypothetical protein